MQPASPSNFKSSFSPKSVIPGNTTTANSYHHPYSCHHHLHHPVNTTSSLTPPMTSSQPSSDNYQFNLLYKRQEANYYVQQILTDLLAIGVLEYESGFDNAINRTYKVVDFKYQYKFDSIKYNDKKIKQLRFYSIKNKFEVAFFFKLIFKKNYFFTQNT
jgi:hypothetical protein